MDIIQILRQDYQRFPDNQTYSIYASDVFFQDPLNRFRGIGRYKKMIGFIRTWFIAPKLDLHNICQTGDSIKTEWTLSWNTPVPWKPRIAIPGWSELRVNQQDIITSHVDFWKCSRLDVIKQHLPTKNR